MDKNKSFESDKEKLWNWWKKALKLMKKSFEIDEESFEIVFTKFNGN